MATVYDDSIQKNMHLFFMTPDTKSKSVTLTEYEHITSDRIIAESANFTMGLLDGKTFTLGSYVIPEFSIKIQYNGKNFKDKVCRVWLEFLDQTYGVIFGKVHKEELSAQRDVLTIYISNIFLEAMSKKISYNSLFGSNEKITVDGFYRNLLRETYIASGFFDNSMYEQIESVAKDFSKTFKDFKELELYILNENETFEISKIWKMLCEFVGAHLQIYYPLVFGEEYGKSLVVSSNDLNIKLVRIDNALDLTVPKNTVFPSNNLFPMGLKTTSNIIALLYPNKEIVPSYQLKPLALTSSAQHLPPYYISCTYDEWSHTDYEAIDFEFEDIAFVCALNESETPQRIYQISDNKMFFNKSQNECFDIVSKVLDYLKIKKYIPSSLDMIFNPLFKPADNIVIKTSQNELLSIPILNCEVSGINSLRAKIESSVTV